MFHKYPMMIYRGGPEKSGDITAEHRIVKDEAEHLLWLDIWGDEVPADILPEKGLEGVVLASDMAENGPEASDLADSAPVEDKPKRRGRPKKQG